MQANKDPTELAEKSSGQSEAETPSPRIYNCIGCRYADQHGLVCNVCLLKIFDEQVEDQRRRKATLLAACFEGHGHKVTLLRRQALLIDVISTTSQRCQLE